MARNVFYSFHYQNDISRVMIVRNRWVTFGDQGTSGVIDHADFEKIQRQGDGAVKRWINEQLVGTSVTVVLIGSNTLNRYYVQYEICESLKRGNAVIGVYINRIRGFNGNVEPPCNTHTVIGYYEDNRPAYFDKVATAIYDYVTDDGYSNLGKWVESAAKRGGKIIG